MIYVRYSRVLAPPTPVKYSWIMAMGRNQSLFVQSKLNTHDYFLDAWWVHDDK